MITRTVLARSLILALALTSSSWSACAGHIPVLIGAGKLPALLAPEAAMFTDAMSLALFEKTSAAPSSKVFNNLRKRAVSPTVARIEYTYDTPQGPVTRIYHGHSGHSLQVVLNQATSPKNSDSSTSETTTEESSSGSDVGDEVEVPRDIAEARYYPSDTNLDIRAHKLPAEGSVVEARDIGDKKNHSWDAELKALRRIEKDIQDKIMPAGGRVTGYVSKSVCESCRDAINVFAETYDTNGIIYELVEPDPKRIVTKPRDPKILESEAASEELFRTRKAYARERLSQMNHGSSRRSSWDAPDAIERLEAEEIATDATISSACVE